mmetsp:Transcript_23011/g.75001  ORF Transcript_23011/g.75001 Transcript_23011/m.75001 type:complete len:200 (+) Transcript_23011:765-1364(+)
MLRCSSPPRPHAHSLAKPEEKTRHNIIHSTRQHKSVQSHAELWRASQADHARPLSLTLLPSSQLLLLVRVRIELLGDELIRPPRLFPERGAPLDRLARCALPIRAEEEHEEAAHLYATREQETCEQAWHSEPSAVRAPNSDGEPNAVEADEVDHGCGRLQSRAAHSPAHGCLYRVCETDEGDDGEAAHRLRKHSLFGSK